LSFEWCGAAIALHALVRARFTGPVGSGQHRAQFPVAALRGVVSECRVRIVEADAARAATGGEYSQRHP
jgi:hypothetical protein